MTSLRLAAVVLLGAVAPAIAQPVDPYADPPKPDAPRDPYGAPAAPAAPAAGDPELDEAVAVALIARARTLAGEGAYADAKQLVVEALVRSPQGGSAAEARALLAELNGKLGIQDAPPAPPPAPAPVDLGLGDFKPPPEDLDAPPTPTTRPRASAFARHAGGVVAGATAGGLLADVFELDGTSAADVTVGALVGAAGGFLAARALGTPELTAGDHALIDSMTTWGLVGGLTLGLAIDPPEGEAYSLNGVFGIAGGYLIGHLAARRTDVSGARMLRVNGYALAGAAAPWLLYAMTSDDTTSADEQAFGLLSTAGLVAGAYLGFRRTRGMSASPTAADEGAPAALFQRDRRGRWAAGGIGLGRPQGGRGAMLSVVSGAF